MNPLIKASLISGISIFVICLVSILFGGAFIALLLITIFPGPVYGIILLLYIRKLSSLRATLFLLLTMALYYVAISFLNIHNYNNHAFPYKILISGVSTSIILKLFYDLIIRDKFQIRTSIFIPAWLGAKASIFATISAFGLRFMGENENSLLSLVSLGLLSIFPLWQYMFSVNLLREQEGYS